MVTVAAVALGSSTYAWFANNNKVTANGLDITAQSEGKLLIIDDNAEFTHGELTSVEMTQNEDNADKLLPTHPIYTLGGTLTEWNHNTSDSYDTAISGDSNNEVAVINGTDDKYYYLSDEVYIKLAGNGAEGATASNLKLTGLNVASTEGGNASASLLNAVRVMLVVDDANAYVYNKDGQEVTTDRLANGSNAFGYKALSSASTLKDTVTAETPIKVSVYVYFDGRDAACTSANYDTDNFAVELQFGVDDDSAQA